MAPKPQVERILDTNPVKTLARIVEEATRSTKEGARRFVEPAEGDIGASQISPPPHCLRSPGLRQIQPAHESSGRAYG